VPVLKSVATDLTGLEKAEKSGTAISVTTMKSMDRQYVFYIPALAQLFKIY
jgi:hypothetical protein